MKRNVLSITFVSFAMFLLATLTQAQVAIFHPTALSPIKGIISWAPSSFHHGVVVPYTGSSSQIGGVGAFKIYNINIKVYEVPYSWNTYDGTKSKEIIGPKVSFGETTSSSQAFTITNIPDKYTEVAVVFSGKAGLYSCFSNLWFRDHPTYVGVTANTKNHNNVQFELKAYDPYCD